MPPWRCLARGMSLDVAATEVAPVRGALWGAAVAFGSDVARTEQSLLQQPLDDDALLEGAVPQPADWLRAWRLCMGPASRGVAAHEAEIE